MENDTPIELQIEKLMNGKLTEIEADKRVVLTPQYERVIETILALTLRLKNLKGELDQKLMAEMDRVGTGKKIEGEHVTVTRVDKKTYKLNIDMKEALQDKELRKLIVKKPQLSGAKVKELAELPPEVDLTITSYLRISHAN